MKRRFFWEPWNIDHVARHGIDISEAEFVVLKAIPPFPRAMADGKSVVWGQTLAGRYLQVIYAYRRDDEIDFEELKLEDILELEQSDASFIYVVHARELSASEKSQLRRLL